MTGEYAMLPRAATSRDTRESVKGRPGGRTQEISRLIGRSLRAVVDTSGLGENTLVVDCDVLQADGGTRTAAITGAYVAIHDAITYGREQGWITGEVLKSSVCAVSVGIVEGEPRLDLHYDDDVVAATDMNVVMTGDGRFVEIQGTAEEEPYSEEELSALLALARSGCEQLTSLQAHALAQGLPPKAVMLDGTPIRPGGSQ